MCTWLRRLRRPLFATNRCIFILLFYLPFRRIQNHSDRLKSKVLFTIFLNYFRNADVKTACTCIWYWRLYAMLFRDDLCSTDIECVKNDGKWQVTIPINTSIYKNILYNYVKHSLHLVISLFIIIIYYIFLRFDFKDKSNWRQVLHDHSSEQFDIWRAPIIQKKSQNKFVLYVNN